MTVGGRDDTKCSLTPEASQRGGRYRGVGARGVGAGAVGAGHDQPGRAGSGFAYPDRGRISIAPSTPPHRMSSSERMWPRDDRWRQVHTDDHTPAAMTTLTA